MLRADILRRGSTVALLSQLGLLGLTANMLVVIMSYRGSESDVAALQWLSLCGGIQMLPNAVLAVALWRKRVGLLGSASQLPSP